MTKKALLLVIVATLLLCLGRAYTFQNEPEGFRGLKWGDLPPGENMENWTRIGGNDLLRYERKDDKLEIGGAKLDSIEYCFYKGQFMKVWIKTQCDNHKPLEDVVKLNFGPGCLKDYSSGVSPIFRTPYQDWSYQWSGDIATVILETKIVRSRLGWGYLTIRSTKIYNQYQDDIERKKKEEARRKEEERQKAAEKGLDDF